MKKLSSKRAKALDISQATKKKVFERDKGCCVICGNNYNVMPNSHYIKRSQNGLGIEQNIFTACTNFTENKCHMRYDQNKLSKDELNKIIDNFKYHYPNWNEDDLIYRKYEHWQVLPYNVPFKKGGFSWDF